MKSQTINIVYGIKTTLLQLEKDIALVEDLLEERKECWNYHKAHNFEEVSTKKIRFTINVYEKKLEYLKAQKQMEEYNLEVAS